MAPSSSKPFRFFDLPQELRDLIYDQALTIQAKQRCCLKAHAESIERPMLLVSQQFRSEIHARTKMTISDVGFVSPTKTIKCMQMHEIFRCPWRAVPIVLGFDSAAYEVSQLQINIAAAFSFQLQNFKPLVEGLIKRMQNLKHSTLRINVPGHHGEAHFISCAREIQLELNSKSWEFLRSFDKMEVHKTMTWDEFWNFELKNLRSRWQQATGRIELI